MSSSLRGNGLGSNELSKGERTPKSTGKAISADLTASRPKPPLK